MSEFLKYLETRSLIYGISDDQVGYMDIGSKSYVYVELKDIPEEYLRIINENLKMHY